MNYPVIITPSAKADIFETNIWLLENRPVAAEKWLWEVSCAVSSLAKFPEKMSEQRRKQGVRRIGQTIAFW